MQLKYYPLLLILPSLGALAAPNPQLQQPAPTSQTATTTTSSITPVGTPTAGTPPPPPTITNPQPPPSTNKQAQNQTPLKLLLKSHDGTDISVSPTATCEPPTSASLKSTDVQTLSKYYQSQQLSSLPPVELAKGARACVPLEAVPGSNAKIEFCGQDVSVTYPDVGKVIDLLLASCTRGEDGGVVDGRAAVADATKAAWTAGWVSASVGGKVLFSVRVVKK
ncbi:hypothetical protein L873DRAFT_1792682 [Choiromyces venosus 120613-1]|uniref:Uncharacterized protein n=1 Tax=Choiromyces venosus 120613-1 TaxID=1336337 RepID=A0A3N4J945_9PEZI|nr:hypothetical protein L873DRAFT_1792682 [Choiromyces venosus 120613-1]